LKKGRVLTEESEIRDVLKKAKHIAVLGLSPKTDRDSNRVATYLQQQGYRVIPVRPGIDTILGEKAYESLDAIDEPVDILDVFRNSAAMPQHAEEALRLKPKVFWMQLNTQNEEAAKRLTDAGIDVVMNQCIKVEHARVIGKKGI